MSSEQWMNDSAIFGIGLGSNLGDRLANLQRGVALVLERVNGGRLLREGGLYETAPVDCPDGSQAFYNSVIEIGAAIRCQALHEILVQIEHDMGRPDQRERHAPRTLDLDILHAGEITVNDPDLIVPHPRIRLRRFVLQPLADCDPSLFLPGQDVSVSQLLAGLNDDPSLVKLVASHWLDR